MNDQNQFSSVLGNKRPFAAKGLTKKFRVFRVQAFRKLGNSRNCKAGIFHVSGRG
jgi:hypothetical protein